MLKRIGKIGWLVFGLLVGIVLGMMIYKNNWFPLSLYRSMTMEAEFSKPYGVFYTPYSKGIPLFADRAYIDELGHPDLENTYIVQLPRHYHESIKLEVDQPVMVYRLLTKANDNSEFDNWALSPTDVSVKGKSCTHTIVRHRSFKAGDIILTNNGEVSSSPILIKVQSHKSMTSIKINGVEKDDNFGLRNLH